MNISLPPHLSIDTIKSESESITSDCVDNQLNRIRELRDYFADYLNKLSGIEKDIISKKVIILDKKGKEFKQLTPSWFKKRSTLFTASSDVCDILGLSEYRGTRTKTIQKKLGYGKKFKGNQCTWHGQKFEKIALGSYMSRYGKKVLDVGLLEHANIKCLGATPDGVTTDGRLIEIKVPFYRKPNGKVKIGYFVQMQTQMEVCNLDVCDFYECVIENYNSEREYDNDIYDEDDGLFLDIIPPTFDLNHVKTPNDRRTSEGMEKGMMGRLGSFRLGPENMFFYPPFEMNNAEQRKWLEEKKKEYPKMVIEYWRIANTAYTEVPRDRKWWSEKKVTENLINTWKRVEELSAGKVHISK